MDKPRTLIADDHQLVAAGLQVLLAPVCDVIATVNDGDALLKAVATHHPDVVVQDMSMPPIDGVELVRQIRQLDPIVKIVVVTMWDDPILATNALRAGASAYVLKNCAASELIGALQAALANKSYITPLVAGGVIQSLTRPAPHRKSEAGLTERQRQVLKLLAEGKSMKEVAAALNLTVRTVAFHKYRMMRLMHIKSSAELIRFAIANNIV